MLIRFQLSYKIRDRCKKRHDSVMIEIEIITKLHKMAYFFGIFIIKAHTDFLFNYFRKIILLFRDLFLKK